MRILHLLPDIANGGAEQQMQYLAREQVRTGHDVSIGYLHDPLNKATSSAGRLYRLRAKGNHDPRLLWRLVQLIRRVQPAIVHTWILQMDVLGGLAALVTRTPWICREPSSAACYDDNWKSRIRVRVVSQANAIVSNSQAGDDYWNQQDTKLTRYVISNALPLPDIDACARLDRSNAPVHDNEKFLLYVGRLDERAKNLRTLVASIALAANALPLRLVICGEGPDKGRLQQWIRDAKLTDRVHLMGHVANVWSYMKTADLLISVSAFEGRPNAVMEAMACECPVLVSDIPAHREFLTDDTALFAKHRNPQVIADTIVKCLSQPQDAAIRARAAKEVAQAWSITSMAEQYEQVYTACQRGR